MNKKAKINLRNLRNFKEGVQSITPKQRLDISVYAYVGTMVGLTMALAAMVIALFYKFDWRTLGLSIFMAFFLLLQYLQLNSVLQQKKQIKVFENTSGDILKAFGKTPMQEEQNVKLDK